MIKDDPPLRYGTKANDKRRMSNDERNGEARMIEPHFGFSSFGHSFVLRHSAFVIVRANLFS
jgi:hypothetical protein